MIHLTNIIFSDQGKRIDYRFDLNGKARKYCAKNSPLYVRYNEDVSQVPMSICAIPFICNWLPIAWFGGFDLMVSELDADFYQSMQLVKKEFAKQFPDNKLTGKLIAEKLVSNTIKRKCKVMLFSGGVDAFATYIRIEKTEPHLATIHGADVEISDQKQWSDLVEFLEVEPMLEKNEKNYIETNVRTFYSYHVELLLKNIGWWGKVQHGLSLIGSLAPLTYLKGYYEIYIASSYTKEVDIAWGSTPQCDELIRWADIKVHHDGYELKRQDKVDLIAKFVKKNEKPLRLRVCYSELKTEFNCSNCEKCFRTILGIILNNQNPNNYGFEVDESVYEKIFSSIGRGSSSKGLQYFWWELMQKSRETDDFFIFGNAEVEERQMERFRKGEINKILIDKLDSTKYSYQHRLKFIIRNRFPWLISIYHKLNPNQ